MALPTLVATSQMVFQGCGRCGGTLENRGTDPFDSRIKQTLQCINCGHEKIELKSDFDSVRKQMWEKGLRKYRNSKKLAFQGNPFVGVKKNLANTANLLQVLGVFFPSLEEKCDFYVDEISKMFDLIDEEEKNRVVDVEASKYRNDSTNGHYYFTTQKTNPSSLSER